jgi:hypothetical protein
LKIGITFAILRCRGTVPEEMEILKTWGRRLDCYSILGFLGLKEFGFFDDF